VGVAHGGDAGGGAVPVGRGVGPGDEDGRQRRPGGNGGAGDVGRVDEGAGRGDGVVRGAGGDGSRLQVGRQADGEAQVERQGPHARAADGQLAAVEYESGRATGIGP
jgi:hypothetical protein